MQNRGRVAVVGCGRVSTRYREVFRDELVDVAEVVMAADLDPAKAEAFAGDFQCATGSGIDDVIAAAPDLVCVMTESGHHAAHALDLLNAGLNVLVEKPVALRPEDALAMRDAAAANGVICAVVKQNRYNPAMRFLRSAVDDGRMGRLVTAGVRVHWSRDQSYYDDPWHGRWAMDGGVLTQQAIHHLDGLQWLAGPVESVCAAGQAILNRLEAEDTAVAILRFKSGALGTIEATTSARPRDFEASLHLVGERALAKVGGQALNLIETWEPVEADADDDAVAATHSQQVPSSYGLGHGPLLRDVLDAVAGDPAASIVSVEEGLQSLRLAHALYASMETGGWVELDDNPLSEQLGIGPRGAAAQG